MKLYSENKNYKLYQGNMLDMLEVIKPESIDSIVTDPPYELNFMGKGWDNSGIAFQSDTWKKCYGVLKPGGYLLAFGGSRTFHRIACTIEDAGFEIRDTIMWLYGSGFPKSMDISKQIDKRGGKNTSFLCNLIKEKREEKNLSQKQLDELMGTSGMINWWEKGERGITPIQFNKLCEILELPFKNIEEAEREVIGSHKMLSGWNLEENKFVDRDITLPSTDLAKQWQGWGTALKPSFEPIIVARKPFKGSLVDNVIEYGVGGINIDECRVDYQDEKDKKSLARPNCIGKQYGGNLEGSPFNEFNKNNLCNKIPNDNGRFPANTILTYDDTDFDEVCGGFPNTKNSKRNSKYNKNTEHTNTYTPPKAIYTENNTYGDSGSASRYFMNCKYTGKDEETRRYIYTPKASKKDRDEGLDNQEEVKVNDGRQTPIDNPFQRGETPRRNGHPTVKPTNLMQYLVRLVTPNGGTVLDPFNGSGSTGKAVMYENKERNKGYKYVGIELTEEYLPIAKARIEYVCNLIEEDKKKDKQLTIFDLGESNE